MTLTKIRAVIYALGLVLAGTALKVGYDVTQHSRNDHLQHHLVLLVINELIRRDPTLRAPIDALIGQPTDAIQDPPAETPDQP